MVSNNQCCNVECIHDINYHIISLADWKDDGCSTKLSESNNSTVHCECNHLTNFAIIAVQTCCILRHIHYQ